jgi:putative restriction endonuclease
MLENNRNHISLNGENFELKDEWDNIPIADSFVKNNKLKGTTGHGEAKLYVGALQKKNFDQFFGKFPASSFFLKKDLMDYLDDAKFEYEQQEQEYREDIAEKWSGYFEEVKKLADREPFTIDRAVPQDQTRYYIKSEDPVFDYFRSIILPIISYISILKLEDGNGKIQFLFRPLLSYSFNPYYHPEKVREETEAIEKKALPEEKKRRLVTARDGQGLYRQELLQESSECIITRVNDERILIASHIKPWSVSDDSEKIDHNNGLVLTPTYDRLFDQGFISFNDDGTIIISPYISPLNVKKLNLSAGKKFNIPKSEKRNAYLEYHRTNIFKK